jgi:Uma2 family endonuclease
MSEEVRTRRWTRKEYDRLIELGLLHEDEPIELVGGQPVICEPQHARHATAIRLANRALRRAFPDDAWEVNVQLPVALDDESEPEPDLCVVPGAARDYLTAHPSRPVLAVEASESTLQLDQHDKGSLYARARIADYWIVNLVDEVVEVYREPAPAAEARYGWEYRMVQRLGRGASISPLAAPAATIAVADLLP